MLTDEEQELQMTQVPSGLQGAQVFISYGQQSNDSLLQYYGFVEPSNPHDTYVVPDLAAAIGPELAAAKLPPSKVQLRERCRASPSCSRIMAMWGLTARLHGCGALKRSCCMTLC